MQNWYELNDAGSLPTPVLLVYPDRIEENIRRMIRIAGSPERLRPHVKTHKMSDVVRLQIRQGITKFKCSTIAEAEMTAQAGGKDILLAFQPVGIQMIRYFDLINHFPQVSFSTIADNPLIINRLNEIAGSKNIKASVWIDINNGMNRTGIEPLLAIDLYRRASAMPHLKVAGLHVYDGHIHEHEILKRTDACNAAFRYVNRLISDIIDSGLDEPAIVAGGTPTFPVHAKRNKTELSPGTCLLWDFNYSVNFSDLDFLHAAVILTSVISKPSENLLCLDLGHKAIAAEMPHPRLKLLNIEVKNYVNHSEEHLVIETARADFFSVGDKFYAIPWHICPTVPRYPNVLTVKEGKISGEWKIDARDRKITL
ncbi:MAG TPA: D-TA family PLP-dependent enzyme [Bacteroidales bacterium]|nr:D-TA family PLP-dependent enzyme [Bacteroidales bacterium]